MIDEEELVEPTSIPPETSRKVKKALEEGDHSLDAAHAKIDFIEGQLEDLKECATQIDKHRSGEWVAVRPEQASQP